ncbi:hypothetical protein BZM27_26960 [Paraburkholderia steynii]|uniref:Uncharacterized protein n=1 Tax=Paraburkholderia steynii TaxID=1245441 RepID=A0A4R0XGN4_9BURK|nr:hypothetical protein BZM27_26960 [Paraburkholderia steynii]
MIEQVGPGSIARQIKLCGIPSREWLRSLRYGQTYMPINRTDGKRIKSQCVVKALLRDHERRYTDQPMSRNT